MKHKKNKSIWENETHPNLWTFSKTSEYNENVSDNMFAHPYSSARVYDDKDWMEIENGRAKEEMMKENFNIPSFILGIRVWILNWYLLFIFCILVDFLANIQNLNKYNALYLNVNSHFDSPLLTPYSLHRVYDFLNCKTVFGVLCTDDGWACIHCPLEPFKILWVYGNVYLSKLNSKS